MGGGGSFLPGEYLNPYGLEPVAKDAEEDGDAWVVLMKGWMEEGMLCGSNDLLLAQTQMDKPGTVQLAYWVL